MCWSVFAAVKMKVKSLSRVQLFATPWTVAYQDPPSMGFSRQECWIGLPFPSQNLFLRRLFSPLQCHLCHKKKSICLSLFKDCLFYSIVSLSILAPILHFLNYYNVSLGNLNVKSYFILFTLLPLLLCWSTVLVILVLFYFILILESAFHFLKKLYIYGVGC